MDEAAIDLNEIRDRVEWPEPDRTLLAGGRRAAPKFPYEPFGAWTDWIAAQADAKSCPPDYVAATLLATASGAIGTTRFVSPWAGWKEPCCLWLALVGNPSSGKSPGANSGLDLLRELESEIASGFDATLRNFEGEKEEAKVLRERWEKEVKDAVGAGKAPPPLPEKAAELEAPVRPRLCVSDATIEAVARLIASHEKLTHHRDELSGWLCNMERYGGSARPFWIEAFGGRPYTVDRVKGGDRPIKIPRLALPIIGGIQPDKLHSALLQSDDDGLAARFLMVWPEPVKPARPQGMPDDSGALNAYRRLLSLTSLSDEHGTTRPKILPLTQEAQVAFELWWKDNAEEQETASGLYLSHAGKTQGILLRLALILELLWWSMDGQASEPECVSKIAVAHAADLIDDYFKPMAIRTYGDAALPKPEKNAVAIIRYFQRKGFDTLNQREVQREKLPGLRTAHDIEQAIDILVEASIVRPSPSREGDTPGKQRKDYAINPKARGR